MREVRQIEIKVLKKIGTIFNEGELIATTIETVLDGQIVMIQIIARVEEKEMIMEGQEKVSLNSY